MHVGRMIVVLTAKSCPSFYFEGKKVLHIFLVMVLKHMMQVSVNLSRIFFYSLVDLGVSTSLSLLRTF